ncbi:unnamed protein product [Phytophthora lilii]|uniref:Unnamed protein product n=1 Tax=Phytophthora lilii TaxID=2077276 RepID=A0A9W6X2S1_9STRA|nr:unnamed protein product [Phytophthora lilii]
MKVLWKEQSTSTTKPSAVFDAYVGRRRNDWIWDTTSSFDYDRRGHSTISIVKAKSTKQSFNPMVANSLYPPNILLLSGEVIGTVIPRCSVKSKYSCHDFDEEHVSTHTPPESHNLQAESHSTNDLSSMVAITMSIEQISDSPNDRVAIRKYGQLCIEREQY